MNNILPILYHQNVLDYLENIFGTVRFVSLHPTTKLYWPSVRLKFIRMLSIFLNDHAIHAISCMRSCSTTWSLQL